MKTVEINLNDYIIFTPNDEAYEIWRKYHEGIKCYGQGFAMKKTEDGKVKMQLHEFMRVFGHRMNPWNVGLPLDNMNVMIERAL